MTKHTPREMKVSDRSLWGDTPFCSQVRMARIVEHSPMNGMDADHLANELAKRWNCHHELVAAVAAIIEYAEDGVAEGGGDPNDNADIRAARVALAKAKGLAA